MTESDDQYQERVSKAVLYAIMRNSAVDIGDGLQGCEMRTMPICVALTELVAQLLAAKAHDLGETSRKELRDVGETFGRALRLKIQKILDSRNVLPHLSGNRQCRRYRATGSISKLAVALGSQLAEPTGWPQRTPGYLSTREVRFSPEGKFVMRWGGQEKGLPVPERAAAASFRSGRADIGCAMLGVG